MSQLYWWWYPKDSMWLHLLAILAGAALGLWLMGDDNMDSLKGKRVIVTGSSGGIGEHIAYEYAKHGANVVVTSRRQEQLDKVIDRCVQLSPTNSSHKAIAADMKDMESIRSLVEQAVKHLGGLDILVLNHITKTPIVPFTGSEEDLEIVFNTMDVNFRSYVQTTALAMPYLTESQGVLVVVNSVMGRIANPKLAPYAASKWALHGFFDSLRSQFIMEKRNIAVTSCTLGLIDTPNAIAGLQSAGSLILQHATPNSADDTAHAIVSGSARRATEVFYPNLSTRFYVQFLNKFFPWAVDAMQRYMFADAVTH